MTSTSPLLVHVPHASTTIPDDVRAGLLLDDVELAAELATMTDWYTDRLAAQALERAGSAAVVVRNPYSRLVVDPERFPDEREVMRSRGMGAVYSRTSALQPLRRPDVEAEQALLDRFFDPYSQSLANHVTEAIDSFDRCVLVDLHSYPSVALPYEIDQAATRPGVCVGTDAFHTPPELRDAVVDAFTGVRGGVAVDTPFAGAYVPLDRYGIDARVSSAMVEIRRDVYLDEPATFEPTIDPVGFADVVDRLAGLFRALVP